MVVIGLGSPFLRDDSVGPAVVRRLRAGGMPGVRLVEAHAGGLLLLEELEGMERAVIVDALLDERRRPGDVLVGGIRAAGRNASCSHDCDLSQTLDLGRALGMALPEDDAIHLVAIVAADVSTFGEQLTPAVHAAVEEACAAVRTLLQRPFAVLQPLPAPGVNEFSGSVVTLDEMRHRAAVLSEPAG